MACVLRLDTAFATTHPPPTPNPHRSWLGAGLTGILETAGIFEYSPTGAAAAVSSVAQCPSAGLAGCMPLLCAAAFPAGALCAQPCRCGGLTFHLPAVLPTLAAQNAMWGFLAFLLWTATFGTNLVLNMLLLMLSILLWLEAACQSHPGLYRVRAPAVGRCGVLWGAVCRPWGQCIWRQWSRSGSGACLPRHPIRLTYAAHCLHLQATGIYGIVVSAVAFYDGTSIL